MLPDLPKTKEQLSAWVLVLSILYLALVYIRAFWVHKSLRRPGKRVNQIIFDATTFAFSILIMVGLVDKDVLDVIGDTSLFLLVGACGGLLYSLHALFPDGEE